MDNEDLLNDVLDVGERMSQLLQDCVDEAHEAGSSLSEFSEILAEWNEVWSKSGRGWKDTLANAPGNALDNL